MFGQSNHPREGVESVHSLPILLPLLKTELVCGNRLRTTAQAVYKKASLIVTSYILSKYRGPTTSGNRQISSKRLSLVLKKKKKKSIVWYHLTPKQEKEPLMICKADNGPRNYWNVRHCEWKTIISKHCNILIECTSKTVYA